jgi:serine protease Do
MAQSVTCSRWRRLACGLLLLALVGLALPAPAAAQNEKGKGKGFQKANPAFLKTNPVFLSAFRDVVAKASESTVRIQCEGKDGEYKSVALGTVVGADGWVLTKASDLQGKIVVKLRDGATFEARLVGVREDHDLAMLKIDAKGLTPVEWRSSKDDAVGYWVASAGLGSEPVAVGVIGVAARELPPSKLPKGKAPAAGGAYLGVVPEPASTGVKIIRVDRNTPAAKAGLQVDDIILAVAGKMVPDEESFRQMLQDRKPGDEVALRVKRGDDELDLKAILGKRPANRADIQNNMGSKLSERRTGFPHILQHDSVVRPEDCGGPLVDLDGKVIGVNISRAGRTESYAVPAEEIQPLLPDLMSGRLAPPPPKAETPPK